MNIFTFYILGSTIPVLSIISSNPWAAIREAEAIDDAGQLIYPTWMLTLPILQRPL